MFERFFGSKPAAETPVPEVEAEKEVKPEKIEEVKKLVFNEKEIVYHSFLSQSEIEKYIAKKLKESGQIEHDWAVTLEQTNLPATIPDKDGKGGWSKTYEFRAVYEKNQPIFGCKISYIESLDSEPYSQIHGQWRFKETFDDR